jgi:hypothetical protein
MRKPTHRQVRQAVMSRVELARAIRPHVEPLLAAGYTWSEIGQAVDRHLRQDALGQQAARARRAPATVPEQCDDGSG